MTHKFTAVVLAIGIGIGNLLATEAPATGGSARPSWCAKGWECIPTSEMVDVTHQIIDLKEALIKARGRRLGWTVGPSIGVYGVVTDNFDVKWVPAAGFSLTWGWRSK